jgi:hypothetical protein
MFDERDLEEQATLSWAVPLGWTAGDVGRCRSCHAPVMWCVTPAGKKAPINADGISHFATCPDRDQWRRRGA